MTLLSISVSAQTNLIIEDSNWTVSEGQRRECADCIGGYNIVIDAVSQNGSGQYSLEIDGNVESVTDLALYENFLSVTGSLPYGGHSVTVFDLGHGSKITEFYGYYLTRSSDGRYFIYKKYFPRFGADRPTVVMLFDVLESGESDKTFLTDVIPEHVGIPVFPPQTRQSVNRWVYEGMSYGDLSQTVFDLNSRKAVFPVTDEFNNVSIASITLWQQSFVTDIPLCVVPLIESTLTSNYLGKESRNVVEQIEIEEGGAFADVSLYNTRGVSTSFRLNLDAACRD